MSERLKVVIADDHPMVRAGLSAALSVDEGIDVVAEAADGREAVEATEQLRPDVVLMDLHMPACNGIEATRQIAARAPATGVLVLTMHEDDASVFTAIRAGARGYLLKGAEGDEILRAIRAVAHGEAIFGSGVAQRLIDYFVSPGRPSPLFPELTGREREILELVAQGADNPAIARRLGLTSKTVRNHVSNILSKLQVSDRAQAIVRAREAGLGQHGG